MDSSKFKEYWKNVNVRLLAMEEKISTWEEVQNPYRGGLSSEVGAQFIIECRHRSSVGEATSDDRTTNQITIQLSREAAVSIRKSVSWLRARIHRQKSRRNFVPPDGSVNWDELRLRHLDELDRALALVEGE